VTGVAHELNPLILIASEGEWLGRSLESVLETSGYSVVRVQGGRRAIELARRLRPDAIILDENLGGMSGVAVCQAFRDDPLFDHAAPIFVTAPAPAADHVRSRAYGAGAWDYCSQPIDVDILLLKLRNFVRGKRDLEQARSKLMVDPATGLYSAHGLERWAETLGALARRQHEAFACVAVQPASGPGAASYEQTDSQAELMTRLAELCQNNSRRSDVVGHLGDSRFAILAPDTDDTGVLGLVERIRKALRASQAAPGWRKEWDLSIGYAAVKDLGDGEVNASDLMGRAQAALTHAYMLNRPLSFDDLPLN
jgi:PleD family two-component response regulator